MAEENNNNTTVNNEAARVVKGTKIFYKMSKRLHCVKRHDTVYSKQPGYVRSTSRIRRSNGECKDFKSII